MGKKLNIYRLPSFKIPKGLRRLRKKDTSNIRVAVILPSLQPIGPVRFALDLSLLLEDHIDFDFYYFEKLPQALDLKDAKELFFMTYEKELDNYDIIHSHGLRPDAYLWYHSNQIKPKTISTLHVYTKKDYNYRYNGLVGSVINKVWKYLDKKHDRIIALTEHMRNYYEKEWELKNIEVIPNTRLIEYEGHDLNVENKIKEFKGDDFALMNISNATEGKGLDQLIRVLPLVPDLKFIHIGKGEEIKNVKELASKLQVLDRCLFLGSLENAHLYYKFSDAAIITSRSEGFSLTLLEAIEMRKACISTDLPAIKRSFSKGEVAFYEMENLVSLQKAINKVKENPETYITNALLKFEQSYSPEIVGQQYLNQYKELIK